MIGQNIGKYQVLDRIGRGGMGTVYRAMDEFLHREVAIKILNAELNEPAVARRFQAEAITVARLNHPGIATVYELFQHDGQWLMVMEFLRGETLEALVLRKGPLALAEAAEIMMQALAALAHAHSLGVVHRDLKPANLMAGAGGLVKVMDFGIARVAGTEHLTNAGLMMGTPAYMAPEQVLGEEIDARADIYAMGAVLFYLLTAELPFKGRSPFELAQARIQGKATPLSAVRAELPAWIGQTVEKALSRQPADRFQSAQAFHDALRRGLAGLPLEEPSAEASATSTGSMATLPPGAFRVVGSSASQSADVPAELMETVLGAPAVAAPGVTTPAAGTSPVPGAASVAPSGAPADAAPELMETVAVASADVAETMLAASPMVERAGPPPAPVRDAVSDSPRSAAPAPPAHSASRAPIYAGVAVLVLVLGGAAMWMQQRGESEPAAARQTGAAASVPAADITSAAPPGTEAAAVDAVPDADASAAAVMGGPAELPSEAPASASSSTASAAPASSPSAAASAPSAPPGAGGAAVAPPSSAGAGGAARGAPAAPSPAAPAAPVSFKDVRVLVVLGKKAEERDAVLRFGDGLIAAVTERDGAPIVSIPERDVSYMAYAHAKDPRWSVILAAPPPDTDFPGGLFRSSRHWLTLQSRSTFMMLRLNDGDWRRVLSTATARTGVQVDTAAPSR